MDDLASVSDADLLARAAAALADDPEPEDAEFWALVGAVRRRGSQTVFDQASAWCLAPDPALRRLGANILGQLGQPEGHPFAAVSTPLLERLLTDADDSVVSCALVALGHLDTGDNDHICRLASSDSNRVRHSVAWCLGRRDDAQARATLIALSRDTDPDVRDWATFGFGSLSDVDSPEIRQALVDRLDDSDADTRAEAMVGLAARSDTRADAVVAAALSDPAAGSLVQEAADLIARRQRLGDDRGR
jgi:HEAT repeat protein